MYIMRQGCDSEMEAALDEVERLRAIVNTLPKTADGVPIELNKHYWVRLRGGITMILCISLKRLKNGWLVGNRSCDPLQFDPCDLYSTREAAEAAGGE